MPTPPDTAVGLDPSDWDQLRREAHEALDMAFDHLEGRTARSLWSPLPENFSESFAEAPPQSGTSNERLFQTIKEELLDRDLGNTHPRFFGWVHGSGTPAGMIPAIFEAAINANMGGREHAPIYLERQLVAWWRELFSFPDSAGGLTVSGTSMATIIAMKAALVRACGSEVRDAGLREGRQLVGYASEQAHSCVARAFDVLGLGKSQLRIIPTDDALQMDTDACAAQIERDRAAGRLPFVLVGTAGTVNTAAIDPLDDLATLAQANGMWMHVDGAFGAMAVLSNTLRPRLRGIERVDSIAFDFHKWMHVTYDAGLILVRNQEHLTEAFSERPEYLRSHAKGMASGGVWPCELGPELSRGFRALKVWYQLKHFGIERLAQCIENNVRQAQRLAKLVDAHTELERLAPVSLNIVVFRYRWPEDGTSANERTTELVAALQSDGIAAPSTTTIRGTTAIRVNLTNHRTRDEDLEALVDAVILRGRELATQPRS